MKPNILFILVDSFRADRCFGEYKTAKTPIIDFLIDKGVYFTKAISSSDYTGPIMQSIFTACFPFGCGTKKENYQKLYSKKTSFLTILKEHGYHKYANMEKAICDQGFAEPFENNDIAFAASDNVHNGLGEKILGKLENKELEEPWFYYNHFMDLHRPCAVPEEFSHLSLSERYNYNISSIDSWIGKMLESIDLKKTLLILAGDHGEYLSPIDNYTGKQDKSSAFSKLIKKSVKKFIPKSMHTPIHEKKKKMITKMYATKLKTPHEKRMLKTRPMEDRMLFDDVVNIPLLFSGYNIEHVKPINNQVGIIDIFPSIFEIIGIPAPITKYNGRSLALLMKGEKFQSNPIYMESSTLMPSNKDPKPVVGLRTDDFKYFRSLKHPKKNVNLYDLKNDPYEDNNIAKNNEEKVKQMEKILTEIKLDYNELQEIEELSKDEQIELKAELKKLGYI